MKKIEDLTKEELDLRIEAIDPLCEWDRPILTKKNIFMQQQWGKLQYARIELVAH